MNFKILRRRFNIMKCFRHFVSIRQCYLFMSFLTFGIYTDHSFSQNGSEEFRSSAAILVSPSKIVGIPMRVRKKLKLRGCLIPQPEGVENQANVISGSFAEKGQKDFAALCSSNNISHIEIVWGGAVRCQSEVGFANDDDYMQEVSPGKKGFSRVITEALGTTKHSGIDDYFVGKASVIRYCDNSKWVELPGSD